MSQQDPELIAAAPPVAPAATVEAPVAPPAIDPQYVANLQRSYAAQQAELNRYEAVKDDIDWMLADETRLQGVKRYRNAYEEASKPQLDPVIEGIYKHIDERTEPSRQYVEDQKKAAAAREQAERDTFVQANIKYANGLVADKKIKPDQIDGLAAYADSLAHRWQRNVTIEEAYKTGTSAFGGTITEAAAAPVLRADEGAVGVPGPSATDSKRWVTDFHGALTDALKAEKRSA